MRNNSLPLVTVIALLVNAVSAGVAPMPAAAATSAAYTPASFSVLPAWFAASPDSMQATADQETYTDDAGRYRFEGLPHGTHKVTLDSATIPPSLRPPDEEQVPVLWLNPGMAQTSDPLSTGVRFTATYDRESSTITGLVFLDQDIVSTRGYLATFAENVRVGRFVVAYPVRLTEAQTRLLSDETDLDAKSMIVRLADASLDDYEHQLSDSVNAVRKRLKKKEVEFLQAGIRDARASGNEEKAFELIEEYNRLTVGAVPSPEWNEQLVTSLLR